MTTKYIARKPPKSEPPQKILVILKKDYPIRAQIADVATAIKNACPDINKKDEPYPTVRMLEFKEGEITYEIAEGKGSRGNIGSL